MLMHSAFGWINVSMHNMNRRDEYISFKFFVSKIILFVIHLVCIIVNKSQAQKHPFQQGVFVLFVTFFHYTMSLFLF
jgi:hypothetical protein